MKSAALVLATVAVMSGSASAFSPQSKASPKPMVELKKAVVSTFAAATIASNVLIPGAADAVDFAMPVSDFGTTQIVAVSETRQGVYKEYDVDVTPQQLDSAESSFKSAKETKSKKGKYTALLAVLVVGSFIIPMAQYFWYVRDDDSSDNFFAQKNAPEPEPEPVKKKGWFN
mmetsp:Transcript_17769/g.25977  ORF Transcript_17769/g.25977 Transcript_17769/m.25977 type:complete len:172 (-) Transcript_17769:254-769(-)